jgi:hypothetical protein
VNRLLLFPRLKFGVGLFQIGDREAQITLRGGQGAVSQEALDVAHIGVVLNAMGGAIVTPDMRGHDHLDPGQVGWLRRDQTVLPGEKVEW